MNKTRREFLKGTAWMGAAAMAAGCRLDRFGFGEGGVMQNYAYRPLRLFGVCPQSCLGSPSC